MEKTLVILIGNPRGSEPVWESMYENLLKPYNADLALCFEYQEDKSPSLYSKAKYIWEVPKYSDWEQYYVENNIPGSWKTIFDWCSTDPNCCGFSGIGDSVGRGSGAILLAFRHYLLNNHKDTMLQYDRIIMTRSDYFYMFEQPILSNEYYWVTDDESYGGVSDRYQQFPSKYVDQALSILDYVGSPLCLEHYLFPNKLISIELVISRHFDSIDFMKNVRTFKRVNFLVSTDRDQTTGLVNNYYYRGGNWPVLGTDKLTIKYLGEYNSAIDNMFIEKVIKKYKGL